MLADDVKNFELGHIHYKQPEILDIVRCTTAIALYISDCIQRSVTSKS